ncbi:MAG: flavin reductase family protein [Ruminococcus sp.]|nr:flavin reductase family protein [Ruminococcus sp.]
MSEFKEISVSEINNNPFDLIGKDWALVTAKNGDGCNTMTASWGGVGIMWNKPVAFTFIRPQRFTYGLIENEEYFTLSFYKEEYRDVLRFCGSKSGRDYDKAKECNITPVYDEKAPYFAEAELVLVCKKLYAQDLDEQSVIAKGEVLKNYSDNDYHRMYISEIVKVLIPNTK